MNIRTAAAGLAAAACVAACDAHTTPAQPFEVGSPQAVMAPIDLTGSWSYQRELVITAPPWVAELVFGVQPEGRITHIRCVDTGAMELEQDGASYSGAATKAVSSCTTSGGQTFVPRPAETAIVDGVQHGRSVRFLWLEDGFLGCPYHAVVAGDIMSGTGRCVVPGHPQSMVPMDPPPAGTSKTVSFRAVRN